MVDHISVSQVNTFSRCEFLWFLKYIEKLPLPSNSTLIRGKAIHKGLQIIYQQKQKTGSYDTNDVLDASIDVLNNPQEEILWDVSKDKILDMTINVLKAYVNSGIAENVKQHQILQVEKRHSIELYSPQGEAITIVGIPDLVLLDRVIDFKTSSRKPSAMDNSNKFQIAFYSLITEKPTIENQYLICKREPEILRLSSKSDNRIREMSQYLFIKTYNKMKSSLASGNFLPNGLFHPWACKYCGFASQSSCPYYMGKAA